MLLDASLARRKAERLEESAAWRLCAPTALLMLALLLIPTLAVFALSMTDAELGAAEMHFIGLDAYAELFKDRDFLRSFRNTALYVAMTAPASVLLGLGLALLIEAGTEGRAFFRSAFFLPVVSLIVAMASVWQYLMHPSFGPINLALNARRPFRASTFSAPATMRLASLGPHRNLAGGRLQHGAVPRRPHEHRPHAL